MFYCFINDSLYLAVVTFYLVVVFLLTSSQLCVCVNNFFNLNSLLLVCFALRPLSS